MKVLTCIASALAVTALLVDPTEASKHGKHMMHLRVSVITEKAAANEQCEWEDRAVRCDKGLQCVILNQLPTEGRCYPISPVEGEQCGGDTYEGPWNTTCRHKDHRCVFISREFSQCQDLSKRQHYRYKDDNDQHPHHHQQKGKSKHSSHGKSKLYEQCKWKDSREDCASGLQCVEENEWYGRCMPTVADAWEQCGGKGWKDPWTASCKSGNYCQKKDEWYSQCLPGEAPSPSDTTPAPKDTSKVEKWGQCGGQGYTGPTTCVDGTQCVKQNNYYSQCKPDHLPVGELCGQNDNKDNVWMYDSCADGAVCKKSSNTEYRCNKN